MNTYESLIDCGVGPIADMAMKCRSVLETHNHAYVAISGGADSDVTLDLMERCRVGLPIEVTYDWHDTGLEYAATKSHLDYLQDRYGVEIHRTRASRTVPVCCKTYGQPFVSKMTSHMMQHLQDHGFNWEDDPLAVLKARYPGATGYVKWWTNSYVSTNGVVSSYCIAKNKWLKEFIVDNPPSFRISAKCCTYAKKAPGRNRAREVGADLYCTGVRKSEGGARSLIGTCFTARDGMDEYRPLFWLTNGQRDEYCRMFGITHSDCYRIWGFSRTGCVGCPFNRDVFSDIDVVDRYEPNVARAARKVFADSYEYTMRYREFRRFKESGGQLRLFT